MGAAAQQMLHFLNARNAVTEGDVGAILDNLLRSPAHRQAGGEVLLHTSIVWSSQLLACMLRKLVSHLEAAGNVREQGVGWGGVGLIHDR